mmetsp:Transcript_51863/g.105434  ORF Transcript_51863/g.105434 Transcript_51863/m.105434 type:complete len:226 (+) Transcript_51863:78-755(+)
MGSWFSSKPKSKKKPPSQVTSKDRAILDLKIARDKTHQFKKKLETQSAKYTTLAKAALKKKDKKKAMLFLKMKKFQQKHIDQIDGKLLKLHEMVSTIEWETQNVEFLNGIQSGTAALNMLHQQMSVEDAERIMDDSAAAIETQNEIDEMLAGSFTAADDEELLQELNDIDTEEAAAVGNAMPDAPVAPVSATDLPDAPVDRPVGPLDVDAKVEETEATGRVAVMA